MNTEMVVFQPTLPARGATHSGSWSAAGVGDFNPRSPHGERRQRPKKRSKKSYFNPRSPHGERHRPVPVCGRRRSISTHAPRTGSDEPYSSVASPRPISTHAPRTGSDRGRQRRRSAGKGFQPTLPARGATLRRPSAGGGRDYFNPRSPHGERHEHDAGAVRVPYISTHAPRTGSDIAKFINIMGTSQFQPTLPARGATSRPEQEDTMKQFQPTLPARGATERPQPADAHGSHFNPRSPHGERLFFVPFGARI